MFLSHNITVPITLSENRHKRFGMNMDPTGSNLSSPCSVLDMYCPQRYWMQILAFPSDGFVMSAHGAVTYDVFAPDNVPSENDNDDPDIVDLYQWWE